MKNKYYIIALIFIIILNIFIFNSVYSNRKNDLSISRVEYQEKEGLSLIESKSLKRLPQKKAEIIFVFNDGSIEEKEWSLSERKRSWNFKKKINSVMIEAPEEIDWNTKNNNWYYKEDWSNEVKLSSISTNPDISYEIDGDNNLYLLYKSKEKLVLEKRDVSGNILLKSDLLNGAIIKNLSRPFLKLVKKDNNELIAIVGWNIKGDNKKGFNLIKINFLDGNKINIVELNIDNENKQSLFAMEGVSDKEFLLLTANISEEFKWEIYKFEGSRITDEIKIPMDINVSDIKLARLINSSEGFNIIWLEKIEWKPVLYYMAINCNGEIINSARKVTELNLDFSQPDPLHVIKVENNFHMVWVDKNSKQIHYLNYLIFDENGKLKNKFLNYKNIGGYCPGIFLVNNNNIIELIYSNYIGHVSFQSQRNTDILWTRLRPDMKKIIPSQLLAGGSKYEKYPVLINKQSGDRFLFWLRDEEERYDIYYKTTNVDIKNKIPSKFSSKPLSTFFSFIINSIYSLLVAFIVWVINVIPIPLILLLVYNILIKSDRNNYLYWSISILLMFAAKVYNISFFFAWDNPVLFNIYRLELIILGLILIIYSIIWYMIKKKIWEINVSFFSNIFIIFWIVLSTYIIYFSHVQNVFR